ncbi:MAG: hypothetical protein D6687_08525 [Acidobacteria bacterium]|jgi:hypothetical protein|nr:MAG: hypothetical protein D6687_08525 [Acidobacteriota bacterium]GIU82179.1 MAG: hypothetical protein KatS3mg006_1243 [Pyrinomonadaceae bacterium]
MKRKEKKEEAILEFYLSAISSQIPESGHLDEDILATLVEGKINQREAEFVIKHLVGCGFCRHLTAELIKFDSTLAEENEISYESEPTRISDTIKNLLSELLRPSPAAIQAFEDKTEEKKENSEIKSQNKQKN